MRIYFVQIQKALTGWQSHIFPILDDNVYANFLSISTSCAAMHAASLTRVRKTVKDELRMSKKIRHKGGSMLLRHLKLLILSKEL